MPNWFLWRLYQFSLWPANPRKWLSLHLHLCYKAFWSVCQSDRGKWLSSIVLFCIPLIMIKVWKLDFKAISLWVSLILILSISPIKLPIYYCNCLFQYMLKRLIYGLVREFCQYSQHFLCEKQSTTVPYNWITNAHLKTTQCRAPAVLRICTTYVSDGSKIAAHIHSAEKQVHSEIIC